MGKQSHRNRAKASGYIIEIVGLAGTNPCKHDNLSDINHKYVQNIPNIDDPCTWVFTSSARKAKHFAKIMDCYDLVHTISVRMPVRNDGEANRPLRAFSMNFLTV